MVDHHSYTKYFFAFLFALAAALIFSSAVFAQSETQVRGALADLGSVYGQPVTSESQARAICNLDEYLTACADIGKKYDLYSAEEEKQVDTILAELKAGVAEKIQACSTPECLFEVANELALRVSRKDKALAAEVDLTPIKIGEKKSIIAAAKEAGVNFDECRNMNPDTAPVDLLRACARLARDTRVQQHIPEEYRGAASGIDRSLELKEALASGKYQCGDNTLEGCGNFCLNPDAAAGGQGAPPVCREIAQTFFGPEGVKQLESAYSQVRQVNDFYAKRVEFQSFTTSDGRVLRDPAAVGRYLEEQGRQGNIEAVEKGMDYMVVNNFVTQEDKEFALQTLRKFKETGGNFGDFDRCRENPQGCERFVPDDRREEFRRSTKFSSIMEEILKGAGVPGPQFCNDPKYSQSCHDAYISALPRIRELAGESPEAARMAADLERSINFNANSFEARNKVEQEFRSQGVVRLGDREFSNFEDMNRFCNENPAVCVAESAKNNYINKDYAAQKYEVIYENRYEGPQTQFSGQGPYPGFQPPGFGGVPPGQTPGFTAPGPGFNLPPGFNKEEALKRFQEWLDNPQGPPPVFAPPPQGQLQKASCPQQYFRPCGDGFYREQARDSFGCYSLSECKPVPGYTPQTCTAFWEGYRFDPGSRQCRREGISGCSNPFPYHTQEECLGANPGVVSPTPFVCPALPTVDSCPVGQRKVVAWSSPECGTYYKCESESTPPPVGSDCVSYGDRLPGSHYMPESPSACFNSGMTQYIIKSTSEIKNCSENQIPGCSSTANQCPSGQYWNGTVCVNTSPTDCPSGQYWYVPPGTTAGYCKSTTETTCPSGQYWNGTACVSSTQTGQKEQIWNSLGLRSWIRADADQTRVDNLKAVCANVPSGSNVWTPQAGDSSSQDFGMPDPEKCRQAASCPSGQYWNGTACVSSGGTSCPTGQYWYVPSGGTSGYCKYNETTTCPSGQYWNGTACVNSTTCPSGQTWNGTSCASSTTCPSFAHDMGSYCMLNNDTSRCASYSNASTDGNYTSSQCTSTSGTGSCPSGQYWYVPSGGTSGYCRSSTETTCPSGQYWNGTACVNSSTSCGTGYYWSGTACVSTCSSTQYWDGTACVNTTQNTSCPEGQYWSGTVSACVNSTTCPSDQYWNGTNCVSSGSTTCPSGYSWSSTNNSCVPDTTGSTSCGSGYYWSGTACVSSCPSTQYWNGTACVDNTSSGGSTTCPSGQYWNGTSCVNSTTCPSDQYWNGTSCVNSTTCSSGQYWNGTACVNTSPTDCPSGQYWDGAACVTSSSSRPPFAHYVAEVRTVFHRFADFVSDLFRR